MFLEAISCCYDFPIILGRDLSDSCSLASGNRFLSHVIEAVLISIYIKKATLETFDRLFTNFLQTTLHTTLLPAAVFEFLYLVCCLRKRIMHCLALLHA